MLTLILWSAVGNVSGVVLDGAIDAGGKMKPFRLFFPAPNIVILGIEDGVDHFADEYDNVSFG